MTRLTLAWGWDDADPSGQNTVHVDTSGELDAALDHIAATATPCLVDVYQGTWTADHPTPPYGFQLLWGHDQRSAMTWLGEESGYALDPNTPPWPEPISHDQGETPPYRTRLTVTAVRRALHEYLNTGRRPTTLPWQPLTH